MSTWAYCMYFDGFFFLIHSTYLFSYFCISHLLYLFMTFCYFYFNIVVSTSWFVILAPLTFAIWTTGFGLSMYFLRFCAAGC